LKPARYEDEEDPYEDEDDTETDLDMLPTMLVYRDGQLEYNWVRVDWEAGRNGIEEFLRRQANLFFCPCFFGLTKIFIPFL
jgi:hypothetical protein